MLLFDKIFAAYDAPKTNCQCMDFDVSLSNKNVEQPNGFSQVSHELESDYARFQFNYEIEQLYTGFVITLLTFGLLFISFPVNPVLHSYNIIYVYYLFYILYKINNNNNN